MKHENMEPKSPLEDLKKLGDILMRRTSEKEYYRFLSIQENCRLKWQATIDKLGSLMKQHERYTFEKAELNKRLVYYSGMWGKERQARRKVENECKFLRNKLDQTYEILRCDRELSGALLAERNNINRSKHVGNDDEITSTGSFLSNLTDVSATQTESNTLEASQKSDQSIDFNAIFGTTFNIDGKETAIAHWLNKSLMEKTFQVQPNQRRITAQTMAGNSKLKKEEKRPKMQSPPVKRSVQHPSVGLTDSNYPKNGEKNSAEVDPIYERIDDYSLLHDIGDKENIRQRGERRDSRANTLLFEFDLNPDVNPHSCQHAFSHRSASRSDACFLCSKKFRFGILAFKCASCKIFVHHDCKSQMKIAAKTRPFPDKYCISDYAPSDGPKVPALIVHCVNEVEIRGLSEQGIYRKSGSEKEVKALKDRFLKNNSSPDLSNVDVNVICGCIKMFLIGLREPLIPTWLWAVFSNAVVNFDGDFINGNILRNLQSAIGLLPKANRDTLAFLVLHLQRVATSEAVQMPISNLAKIFGPTIVGYSKQLPDPVTILGETVIQQNVMQHFLSIPTDYWFSFICDDMSSE